MGCRSVFRRRMTGCRARCRAPLRRSPTTFQADEVPSASAVPFPVPMSTVRRRVISVYLTQGSIGLALMLWMSWRHYAEAAGIVHRLGPNATILMVILVGFAA